MNRKSNYSTVIPACLRRSEASASRRQAKAHRRQFIWEFCKNLFWKNGLSSLRHARACPGHPRREAASGLSGQCIGPTRTAGDKRTSKRKRSCLSTDRAVCHPSASRSPFRLRRLGRRAQDVRRCADPAAPCAAGHPFICVHPAIGDPGFDAARGLGRRAAPSFRSADKQSIACRRHYRFRAASTGSQPSCPTWMAGTSPAMTARGCIR
jgi:hypothetical protein